MVHTSTLSARRTTYSKAPSPAVYRLLMSITLDFSRGADSPWLKFVVSDDIATAWNVQDVHSESDPWMLWYFLVHAMIDGEYIQSALQLRTLRDRLFPHYNRVPHRDRLRFAKLLDWTDFSEFEQAQSFRHSLSSTGDLGPESMVTKTERGDRSLLPREAFQWARLTVELGSIPENWTEVLRSTVSLRTLTALDNGDPIWGCTPLLGLVKGTVWGYLHLPPDKRIRSIVALIRHVLEQWLELLEDTGINLLAYGKWEQGVLRRCLFLPRPHTRSITILEDS